MRESETGRRRRDGSLGRRGEVDRWGDIYANMPVRKMIAMYDYDPQELSPNVDSEVALFLKVLVFLLQSFKTIIWYTIVL